MPPENSFEHQTGSKLTDLFARARGNESPWTAMSSMVTALRGLCSSTHSMRQIETWLVQRRVSDLVYERDLECDGCIKPLGMTFRDGFRIVLNLSVPATRLRFTLAHEVCHTFFYEHVPGLKFMPHEPDEIEESLCDFGAAELLMPKQSVLKKADCAPVSLRSLDGLAGSFGVSPEAMLVRLRSLRLWKAELCSWSRAADGDFICRKNGIDCKERWTWMDNALLRAWETGKPTTGRTFLECVGATGSRRVRPICYDLQRRANRVLALLGTWAIPAPASEPPLFKKDNVEKGQPCTGTLWLAPGHGEA